MAVEVSLNTPLADALNNVVQSKLTEVGWSTGGLDDSALTEYIILMLVNGKTQDQIAAELSNDLLNLDPDDPAAVQFAGWLFQQVEQLQRQLNGDAIPNQQAAQSGQGQSDTGIGRLSQQASKLSDGSADSPDTEMGETMSSGLDGAMYASQRARLNLSRTLLTGHRSPTGPKSMRNGGRNGNRRLIGQISKAMDRSNDAALHRIRPQQGTERINMHNKQPPKGPRVDQARNHRPISNGRPMGMPNIGMPKGGPGGAIMNMSSQQQMQLLAFYEEQARMMSQIFSPQQQQMLMPGAPQPAINPAFRNGVNQQQGRSLFDRVEANPQRHSGGFNRRQQPNGGSMQARAPRAIITSSDDQRAPNGDISSSMEVESSQNTATEPSPDTTCRFNLDCTKKDCPYAHQSPAAPPGTVIDVNDNCPFGAACKNRKCVGRHPSPSQKPTNHTEQDCKFFPNCTNPNCPYRHPTMAMCRNGADCTREGCKFVHVNITCKFNPCLNPTCHYKHAEGQKRGAFSDKVWTAGGNQEEHVSERKFVDNEADGEELIVSENQGLGSQSSEHGTEIAT